MSEPTPIETIRLQCVEYGRVSKKNERGWPDAAYRRRRVVVYCPEMTWRPGETIPFGGEDRLRGPFWTTMPTGRPCWSLRTCRKRALA
jgi:hypothetical protein